jgi:hypothetical protein
MVNETAGIRDTYFEMKPFVFARSVWSVIAIQGKAGKSPTRHFARFGPGQQYENSRLRTMRSVGAIVPPAADCALAIATTEAEG